MSALPAPSRPIDVQRRLVELGRIRLGDKGSRGEPRRLTTFRLTSASKTHLEAAAAEYGGEVRRWQGAPDEGYWELLTTSSELRIRIPPTMASYSQMYELWDAGGCVRRCDGVRESVSAVPCLCDAAKRACAITTRVSVMLRGVPGLGVWRLETHGWNAATTLPATLELLGAVGAPWIPAVLRLEQRSQRKRVDGRAQTRRFVVPVVDLVEVSVDDLLVAAGPSADTVPAPRLSEGSVSRRERVERPALPPGPPPPSEPSAFRPHAAGTDPAPAGDTPPSADHAPEADASPVSGAPDEPVAQQASTGAVEPATGGSAPAPETTQCDSTSDPAMPPVVQCRREAGHAGAHKTADTSWPNR